MQPNVLRAVGYRRVSSQEQTEGHSLDAQTVHIQNYVQSQGWNLVQIYTDAGISAKKGSQRPAFEQMLKDAREGLFDVVVVDKIDRFYRHLSGLLSTLEQLNSCSVSFASVQEKLDFTTPWGKLMLTVLGMLAEIYIDNLRQETKKGHMQRARRGLWNGMVPFGYCKGLCSSCEDPNGKDYCPNYGHPNLSDGKRLIAHPIESIGVKFAFEWYASGEYSMKSIAEKLDVTKLTLPDGSEVEMRQKGHPGYSEAGIFSKDMIRCLLQRVAYIGKLPYVGFDNNGKYRSRKPPIETYDGLQPALVSQELFDQVSAIRKAYGNNPVKRNNGTIRCYLLTGILFCSNCGSRMRGISCNKYSYYDDGWKIDGVTNCHQKPISAPKIEDAVFRVIRDAVNRATEQRTIEALHERRDQAEQRFQRAKELYLAGQMTREYYEREREQYEEQEYHLRENKRYATMALYDLMRSELPRWDALSPIEKKRLLRLAIEAAWIQGNALVALQPSIAFLPILGDLDIARLGLSICGEGGIRTHGGYETHNGFRDRPIRPLWHLSSFAPEL